MQDFEKSLLFTLKKSLYALFVTMLIYRVITDIATIWNMFIIHFFNNRFYKLWNKLNIPKYLTNLYYNYSLYLFNK